MQNGRVLALPEIPGERQVVYLYIGEATRWRRERVYCLGARCRQVDRFPAGHKRTAPNNLAFSLVQATLSCGD